MGLVPKAYFRIESPYVVGWGHIGRCRALAAELAQRGFSVTFLVSGSNRNNELARVEQVVGLPVLRLSGSGSLRDARVHLRTGSPHDIVVVDGYGIDRDWLELGCDGFQVVRVDDFADEPSDRWVVVNANLESKALMELQHGRGLSAGFDTRALFGWQYALVGTSYRHARPVYTVCPSLERLGVSLGSGVSQRVMAELVRALADIVREIPTIRIEIAGPSVPAIQVCKDHDLESAIHFLPPVSSLLDFNLRQDVVIGALGHGNWERMVLGVPTISLRTHENQTSTPDLERARVTRHLGSAHEVTARDLANAVLDLMPEAARFQLWSRARQAIDGRGVERVVDVLTSSGESPTIEIEKWRQEGDTISYTLGGAFKSSQYVSRDSAILTRPAVTLAHGVLRRRETLWHLDAACSLALTRAETSMSLGAALQSLRALSDDPAPVRLAPVSQRVGVETVGICVATRSWYQQLGFLSELVGEILLLGFAVETGVDPSDMQPCDTLFLVGFDQLVDADSRRRFGRVLVVHESDLPQGRGWSPLTWQVLADAERVVVCLIDAEDEVDTGRILSSTELHLIGTETLGELRAAQACATRELILGHLSHGARDLIGRPQIGTASYYSRRTPLDSAVKPTDRLEDIFNLLRVSDPDRYPVYLEHRSKKWILRMDRDDS